MTTTKITGADKRLGFETAPRLGATSVQLDVTDEPSAVGAWLAKRSVGNAGPTGTFHDAAGLVR